MSYIQHVLDSFTYWNTAVGMAASLGVIQDSSRELGVKAPTGTGCAGFVGVTLTSRETTPSSGVPAASAGPQSIQTAGIAVGTAYSAIAIGDHVKFYSTGGKFMSAEQVTPSASWVVGRAVTAASNDGDLFSFIIEPQYITV